MHEYWQRQQPDKPLYPDMVWSRPENRAFAGKLLIIGGNAYGFAAPAEAYAAAEQAGIGVARVLLPDSLRKTVGVAFEAGEYAPSTPSGSFSQKALAEMLSLAGWADGVLMDGDLGRNSETAIVLEKFVGKYRGLLTVSGDAADYFLAMPDALLGRPQSLLVLDFSQLQKLFMGAHFPKALTSDMDFVRLVEALHLFSLQHRAYIMLQHDATVFSAVEGKVCSTKTAASRRTTTSNLAAASSVWWLQNPGKAYEAFATAVVA